MKLPTQKKILREDVKEAPAWVDKLIFPINSFFETVFNGLSRQITFTENIACQIKEMEFSTTAAYDGTAANWTDVTFPKTIKTRAQGVILLQLTDLGPTGGRLSSYRPIDGLITGTGTISSAGTTLTGVGTLFLTELYIGARLYSDDQEFRVDSIASNTSATVAVAPSPALSGDTFTASTDTGSVCIDWTENNEEIVIGLIRGLAASKDYRLRVMVV